MKLWYEARNFGEGTDHERLDNRVHGGDCDCNPTTKLTQPLRVYSYEAEADFSTRRFQLVEPCWIQRCGEDRWIVCNPAGTGQIVVVDEQIKRIIDLFFSPGTLHEVCAKGGGWQTGHLQRVVQILWELGILVRSGETMPPPEQEKDDELTAWLHITNACNLRCTYCYIYKTSERMSQDTAFKAVDALFRSAGKEGYKRIVIKYAGGEASLRMKDVMMVHDYAAQKASETGIGLRGVLLTNGVMITKRIIEQLRERAIGVTISLDGIGAYHDKQRPFVGGKGSFEYVDRSIGLLLAHEMPPHISITVSRHNLAGVPALMAYILERDLTFTLNFYRDNDHAIGPEQLLYDEQEMIDGMRNVYQVIEANLPRRSLLADLIDLVDMQAPHRHACGAGINYLAINHKGGVSRCHMVQNQVLTTVADANPLRVLWTAREGLQNLAVDEREGCRECTWRYWCGGGCPLLTYRMTGRYDIKSPNCHIYQALFPDVLRLEALRLLRYTIPLELEKPSCRKTSTTTL